MSAQLPFELDNPLEVPVSLSQLMEDGVIHRVRTRTGDLAWLVTSYDEVRSLLADDRLGRSHPDPETAARSGEGVLIVGPVGNYDTEDADHAKRRGLLQPMFSAKRMRRLKPRVDELATALIDEVAASGSPADLRQALALPLPLQVICELLGVPYADRERFGAWRAAARNLEGNQARAEQGRTQLFVYGLQLAAQKRKNPGEDVISGLVAENLGAEEIATLSMVLLFAGYETTVAAIHLGILALLDDPDRWQALARDPDLVPTAVEEILRAPGHSAGGIPRYARTDVRIGDVTVQAGELVLLDTRAANHDPAVFAGPGRFDISRRGPAHLTFGHGGHYCIGAPLARIELQAVFTQLAARFPGMRLAAPVQELPFRPGRETGLPVRW
jgi:pentalenolactone synthase